ncbi:MAG: hypothetical protein CM1200mP18_01260 [Gammaproteobacteria bacterium]|nr:MAG: hypothetical protein CM1200mP18_01260 [Gammaproteobacteria bacterium]
MKLAFDENGSVTAGTSSPLTDGAAATLVCSETYAQENGLEPIARIRSIAVSGCKPETMGLGPIFASRKALARAELTADNIDVVEINEAFATQSIASVRDRGPRYRQSQHRWRCNCHRTSTWCDRRTNHGQSRADSQA